MAQNYQTLLLEIIQAIEDKHILDAALKTYNLQLLSREVNDSRLNFLVFRLMGLFLLFLQKPKAAQICFESMRDVSCQ